MDKEGTPFGDSIWLHSIYIGQCSAANITECNCSLNSKKFSIHHWYNHQLGPICILHTIILRFVKKLMKLKILSSRTWFRLVKDSQKTIAISASQPWSKSTYGLGLTWFKLKSIFWLGQFWNMELLPLCPNNDWTRSIQYINIICKFKHYA